MTELARLPDGGKLAYRVIGSGSPVVLLRPLGGSMALWGELAERLASRHRVVMLDPRGVGGSTAPPFGATTRDMARDVVALLDHLRLDRSAVFGLSLGGMVGSWVAIDHPQRVERLVLASTLPRPRDLSLRGARAALHMAGALWRRGVRSELSMVHRVLSRPFRTQHPERVRQIDAAIRREPTSRAHLFALGAAAARHDPGERWRDIGCSTLVLAGELDPLIGETARADLLEHIPHARLEMIAGAGHDLSLEKPRQTADRVLAFLAEPT